jgi:hypothetical protein
MTSSPITKRTQGVSLCGEREEPTMTNPETLKERQLTPEQRRAVRIMAKALFQQFQLRGYSTSHVIDFASELLELLTQSIKAPASSANSDSELIPSLEANP